MSRLLAPLCTTLLAAFLPAADDVPLVVALVPLEVVHIDGNRVDAAQPAAKAMEDLIQVQLSDTGQITLVERGRIDEVLKEQALSLSGLVDPATAARVGNLLKADVMVVGRVRPLDKNKRLATLRAVAVADTRVLWTAEAQGDDGALAGQAASLGAALAVAMRSATGRPPLTIGTTPLSAVKHHERAAALRAVGAPEEAVAEEMLALRHDPTLVDAEVGFVAALAAAGFEGLAGAEAQAAVERGGPLAAKLKEFVGRSAMPMPAQMTRSEDSLVATNLKRFIDTLEQRARSASPAEVVKVRKDCVRAWCLLGDAYVAEHRDRKASEAYREALKRIWDLRASSPAVILDPNFTFPSICDSFAAKAIEQSAYGPFIDRRLRSVLRAALERNEKLPEGAKPPLVVYSAELPLADRVALPRANGGYSLLLRIKPGVLPTQAVLTRCRISGVKQHDQWKDINDNFQGGLLDTHWVGSEADGVFARKGVAWPASGPFGNDAVFGRQRFRGRSVPNELINVLEECRRRGEHDCGFVLDDAIGKPAQLPEMAVHVEFVMPSGISATGFESSPRTHLTLGVHHLLAGRVEDARREFQALERGGKDSEAMQLREFAADLLSICGERP